MGSSFTLINDFVAEVSKRNAYSGLRPVSSRNVLFLLHSAIISSLEMDITEESLLEDRRRLDFFFFLLFLSLFLDR
uniref:Uncharacterized protein n=1 Tax=Lepeophtheirus salmonis TaxID=72036 RepID=A0A0K2TBI8_LEPSM